MVVDLLRRDDDTGQASVGGEGSRAMVLAEAGLDCRSCRVALDAAHTVAYRLGRGRLHMESMEDRSGWLAKSRDLLVAQG